MNSERKEINHKLEIAQVKLRHWSGWLTAISALGKFFCFKRLKNFENLILCSGLIMSFANFHGNIWKMYGKFFCGLYGPFFGIIAGPIGIRLSYEKEIRQMKCLSNAFICLVREKIMQSKL